MEHCQHRPRALRALVTVLVVLLASCFALQARDGGALWRESAKDAGAVHFVSNAFPTAEAGLVGER